MNENPGAESFAELKRREQITNPQSEVVHFPASEGLPLDSGAVLAPFSVAYQTYGTLNADKSNLILVCHALTGDQYVASAHPVTGKPGWWETMVGPGKPIDTDRYFILCPNVIGGCMGSTGPARSTPRRAALTDPIFRSSPCATWSGPKPGCSITSASTRP